MGILSKKKSKNINNSIQEIIQLPEPSVIEEILEESIANIEEPSPKESCFQQQAMLESIEESTVPVESKNSYSPNDLVGKVAVHIESGIREVVVGWGVYSWPHQSAYITLGDSGRIPFNFFKEFFEVSM